MTWFVYFVTFLTAICVIVWLAVFVVLCTPRSWQLPMRKRVAKK